MERYTLGKEMKTIFTALVLGILAYGIAIGVVNALPSLPQVKYITQEVYVDRPVLVERIITQEITKEIEVERIRYVYRPRELREFSDLAELEKWVMPRAMGLIFTRKAWWDCDDFAERLQIMAITNGYLMSLSPVYLGDVWGKRVMIRDWYVPYHMGNMTMIGNDIYYIEPQNGKVVWVINRDTIPEIQARDVGDFAQASEPNWGKGGNPNKEGGKK